MRNYINIIKLKLQEDIYCKFYQNLSAIPGECVKSDTEPPPEITLRKLSVEKSRADAALAGSSPGIAARKYSVVSSKYAFDMDEQWPGLKQLVQRDKSCISDT